MKSILYLLLFFTNSLFAQNNTFNYNLKSQLSYFKPNIENYFDENGNSLTNSHRQDTLIFTGQAEGNSFGYSVSTAGDVNNDGFSDVIIGSHGNNSGETGGRAYIYFGEVNMNNIADVTLNGEAIDNNFGYSVSTAGDVNNDGFSDVIVGAWGFNSGFGRVYIYFGGVNMNNIADVILTGENSNGYFGYSVSTSGDVNNDGFSDVIVGEMGYYGNRGRAYIFYGGLVMDNIADVIMTGENINLFLGLPVSTGGDVNNDGFSDVIVGAYGYNSGTGKVNLYYGGENMDNIADVVMTGDTNSNYFNNLSSAGDVNNDGYSDIIVGAWGYKGNKGRVYIYHGSSNMNNIADFTMSGENINDAFGISVSTAGDVNNDGYSDIIVGANGYNNHQGKSYLFYGSLSMDSIADFTMSGDAINNNFGYSVSTAGDVNNDSYSDVIAGAYGYLNYTGKAYIFKKEIEKIQIDLKILVEAVYYPLFNLLSRRDTLKVFLREATSPFSIIDSAKSKIDSISFTGLFSFSNAETGNYYIVVNHFNSLETWSKAGGETLINNGSIYNYDFTTSASQAYGNNMKLKGSKYCFYSGDIDKNGYIDGLDLNRLDNDSYSFLTGYNLPSDLNGDNVVDGLDFLIGDNNVPNFIGVITP